MTGNYLKIAFEGPDKLGKTTQAKLLAEALGCAYIKYPYEGEFGGKRVREILNGDHQFEPASFQALQVMNRLLTQSYVDECGRRDGVVVFDRYKLSGMVYGVADGLPVEWCKALTDMLPDVDVTFIFEGTPFGKDDDIYGEKQSSVSKLYTELRHYDKSTHVYVPANHSIEELHMYICNHTTLARGDDE